jgi:primosomal protein N'
LRYSENKKGVFLETPMLILAITGKSAVVLVPSIVVTNRFVKGFDFDFTSFLGIARRDA